MLRTFGLPKIYSFTVCDDGYTHSYKYKTSRKTEKCEFCGRGRSSARKFYYFNPFDSNSQIMKWFNSKAMCTELLNGIFWQKLNFFNLFYVTFYSRLGIMHALKNEMKPQSIMKEYWDGKRFLDFSKMFLGSGKADLRNLLFGVHFFIFLYFNAILHK